MLNKLKKENSGFTIIEVMIVLLIAGVILLIVFLAVPALQRNSRNTGRKNDVARLGAAASEYVSNNNGKTPAAGSEATITSSAGQLAQYDAGDFSIASATGAQIKDVKKVRLVTGVKCDVDGKVSSAGATSRQMAIQYAAENSNGDQSTNATPVCQDV